MLNVLIVKNTGLTLFTPGLPAINPMAVRTRPCSLHPETPANCFTVFRYKWNLGPRTSSPFGSAFTSLNLLPVNQEMHILVLLSSCVILENYVPQNSFLEKKKVSIYALYQWSSNLNVRENHQEDPRAPARVSGGEGRAETWERAHCGVPRRPPCWGFTGRAFENCCSSMFKVLWTYTLQIMSSPGAGDQLTACSCFGSAGPHNSTCYFV